MNFVGNPEPSTTVVRKMKEIRANATNSLFVNAGDFFQGTPYYTLFKSSVISAVMSKMGYDFACLGNHEFDDGPDNLAPFLREMNQSNVTFLTPTTKIGSNPGPYVEFYDETYSFQNENVTEIDILVGGHTNTFLYTGEDHPKEDTPEGPYPYVVNRSDGSRALVVQDFRFGKYLGRLDVTFNSAGHVVAWGGNPILLNASVKEDEEMICVLEPFKQNLTERNEASGG
ncbi:hypothetical protein MTO96_008068 [Rhipicephalus appendiculatus]